MSDQVFSGRDVAEALSQAARALGQPEASLRYVVLERETVARLGLTARPARIAVLMGAAPARSSERRSDRHESPPLPQPPADDAEWLERIVAALSAVVGGPIEARWEGENELRLSGRGTAPLLDGEGRVLDALEHVLGAIARGRMEGPHLRLECDGFREVRDAWLQQRVRELCARVLETRQPVEMEPLNAYERRLAHMTVAEHASLRSHSEGQGRDRRVTIGLADAGPA